MQYASTLQHRHQLFKYLVEYEWLQTLYFIIGTLFQLCVDMSNMINQSSIGASQSQFNQSPMVFSWAHQYKDAKYSLVFPQ